jgi:hypothetical protein
MIKQKYVPVFTIIVCLLLAGSLMFISSCAKSTPTNDGNTATPQAKAPDAATPKPPAENKPAANPPAEANAPAAVQANVPADLVPIDINLPKKITIGTKTNITIDNLDKTSTAVRPPFLAPKGVKNVALGKPVTSSDLWPLIGKLSFVTDGEKAGDDGYFVPLAFDKQWVQIDLQGQYTIYAVVVWHFHSQERVYKDVVVQVADDPNITKNVVTIFNNDNDSSSGLGEGKDMHYVETNQGKLIDAKGVKGRYVRLYSNGNTTDLENHYIEVEVYGLPAK